jgi:hypothetical protein
MLRFRAVTLRNLQCGYQQVGVVLVSCWNEAVGYGWTGQQPSSGFFDIARATLGRIYFLDRFWLSSSWSVVSPLLWSKSKTKYFGFMRWPHIDLGAQGLNGFNG